MCVWIGLWDFDAVAFFFPEKRLVNFDPEYRTFRSNFIEIPFFFGTFKGS